MSELGAKGLSLQYGKPGECHRNDTNAALGSGMSAASTLQRIDGRLTLNMQKTVQYYDTHGALVCVLVWLGGRTIALVDHTCRQHL